MRRTHCGKAILSVVAISLLAYMLGNEINQTEYLIMTRILPLLFLSNLTAQIKATWAVGPAPCWTEYLRTNAGR